MRDAQLSLDTLDVVAQLTASGPMQSGSRAETESGGPPDRGLALSLEGWRTPCDRDHHPSKIDGNNTRTDMQIQLAHQASLSSWASPRAHDWKNMTYNLWTKNLSNDATLASWPTPSANETDENLDTVLARKKRLAETKDRMPGLMKLGTVVQQTGTGQLNPALSRWLMGLPPEWDDCAVTAMQSLRRSRKRS